MIINAITRMLGGTWKLRERCHKCNNQFAKRWMGTIYTRYLQSKGSWISIKANFKNKPLFPHGIYGIFISGGVTIGKDCVIFQQVTIGSNTLIDSGGIGAPKIGDFCYIGAGAKIIGNVKVGDNVRIGANSVVIKDVPDNSVIFNDAQIIKTKNEKQNNKFYHKYNGKWHYYKNGNPHIVIDKREIQILDSCF